jgi:hypothetical protein
MKIMERGEIKPNCSPGTVRTYLGRCFSLRDIAPRAYLDASAPGRLQELLQHVVIHTADSQ